MERTFLRATVQLGHCLLEGAFSHILVAARDGLLYLTQVTPDAAAACSISNAVALVLTDAFFSGSAIGHFKFGYSQIGMGAVYKAAQQMRQA